MWVPGAEKASGATGYSERKEVSIMLRITLLLATAAMLVLVLATTAQAQGTEANEKIPLTFSTSNPCTGEELLVEGTLHLVQNFTEDRSGGSHLTQHLSFKGEAVSPSGAEYIVQTEDSANVKADADSANALTLSTKFHYIRLAETTPNDDFIEYGTIHLTQNANGEFTADFRHTQAACK